MVLKIRRAIYQASWFILLTLLVGGCRDVVIAPPPPTPIPLKVAYTPALQPWIGSLVSCAENQPKIALFLEELPLDQQDLIRYDAILRLGSETEVNENAFVLGYDDLLIIVNSLNPVTSISDIGLQDLLSGSLDTWEKLSPPNAIYLVSVLPFTYMPGSDLSLPVDSDNKSDYIAAPEARLVNDPGQVIEGVKEEEGGIGIVPSSWLVTDFPGIKIIGEPIKARIPVLVITKSEPSGALRDLLGCASKL